MTIEFGNLARANLDALANFLEVRPIGRGSSKLREKPGRGVRAAQLREGAERYITENELFSKSDNERLSAYRALLTQASNGVSDDLKKGGFLSLDTCYDVADGANMWDATVAGSI